MMCAHHIPPAAPPAEHQSCHQSGTARRLALLIAVTLAAIVVCVGPLWDWLATWVLTLDSPLVSTVMPLFKWLWLIIALSVIAAFAYVYLVVIRKIRYNRLMGGLE
jgi:hypothetical protein